ASPLRWWCRRPPGKEKAPAPTVPHRAPVEEMPLCPHAGQDAAAAPGIAGSVNKSAAAGGGIAVAAGAAALLLGDRGPQLRAVLGTSLEAVEAGIEQIAANVLVLEHPRLTLMQARNMLQRFARAKRQLSEDMKRQLQVMAGL